MKSRACDGSGFFVSRQTCADRQVPLAGHELAMSADVAFEWHDTKQPLKITPGDPLFYLHFEADRPDRAIQVVEAEIMPEIDTCIRHIGGAVSYGNQTLSPFEEAARVRPQKLVHPKGAADGAAAYPSNLIRIQRPIAG